MEKFVSVAVWSIGPGEAEEVGFYQVGDSNLQDAVASVWLLLEEIDQKPIGANHKLVLKAWYE